MALCFPIFRPQNDSYSSELASKMYVIIIGAPRSGTNMLRDALTSLPSVATWPCDEINYIWRHGNLRYPSDEFTPDLATPRIKAYIRRQFEKMQTRSGQPVLVEKTCANALRVDFVDAVVPEAKFVHIYRNGLDVVDSAMKRWKAPLDIPYLARKARYVPLSDMPFYATRYAANRLYRVLSRRDRLAFWGPQLSDMQSLLAEYTLEEVCALQWKRCVENASASFANMPDGKVINICYEQFVAAPQAELKRITDFLGFASRDADIANAVTPVTPTRVGAGKKSLSDRQRDRLSELVGNTLDRLGYAA